MGYYQVRRIARLVVLIVLVLPLLATAQPVQVRRIAFLGFGPPPSAAAPRPPHAAAAAPERRRVAPLGALGGRPRDGRLGKAGGHHRYQGGAVAVSVTRGMRRTRHLGGSFLV
jgi:hypothetical protein